MKKFKNAAQAKKYFELLAIKEAQAKFSILKTPHADLERLSIENLRNEINKIDNILLNYEESELKSTYLRGRDFVFTEGYNGGKGFIFNYGSSFVNKKKQILDIIKTKETETKIESISELIKTIPEEGIRENLNQQFKELEDQANIFKIAEKKLDKEEEKFNAEKKELELQNSRVEIFDKKSQTWLKIFGKEAIASTLGAFLLLIMTIAFLYAMFNNIEISDTIKSAYFVVLGYFFAQSGKNDK